MHSINKSCQPSSYTSTTSVAIFICYLIYCNSLLPYLCTFILTRLPSPHCNQSDPFTIVDHILILQSQDSPMSSRFSQSKMKLFTRPYIILPYLTITLSLLVTLLASSAAATLISLLLLKPTPLSLCTCCCFWLKGFSLVHLHGCLPHFF